VLEDRNVRQLLYTGHRTVGLTDAAVATPGPGQVRVDVAYTGICGTDLHIYHGDMDARVRPPAPIGHEMSGRVAAVGPGTSGWAPGDPVTVMPLQWCGTCPACLAGHETICQNLVFIGIDAPGSMQQSWVVPAGTLIRLPDGLPLRTAALVETAAVAVHDVRRAGLTAGETVVVVGGGPVGLLIAVTARQAGGDVLLVEPNAYRRSVAADLGFAVSDPAASDVTATVDDWTHGAGARVAFEVSGSAAGVDTAVDVLAVRGRLCLVPIYPVPRSVSLHRFFWRELTLAGARLYERADFERAVELVVDGTVPADALITHVMPLTEAGLAFDTLDAGTGVMKVLIDCQA